MLKAPPTILTPEVVGIGFVLWLASIGGASFAMHTGRLAEGWMFAVMSWPLVLGALVVKIERIILRRRGEWAPVEAHELVRAPAPEQAPRPDPDAGADRGARP